MSGQPTCPICLNAYGTVATSIQASWNYHVQCPVCGNFELDRNAYDDYLDPQAGRGVALSALHRARIAHKIRTSSNQKSKPKVESEFLERYIKDGCPGPSPKEQAVNAVRYIGDAVTRSGEKIGKLDPGFFAIIGASSPTSAGNLLFELVDLGQINGIKQAPIGAPPRLMRSHFKRVGNLRRREEGKGFWSLRVYGNEIW